MAQKPLVIVTRKLPDAIETRMMELFEARLNPDDQPMGKAGLIEAVKGCDVLVPTVTDLRRRIGEVRDAELARAPEAERGRLREFADAFAARLLHERRGELDDEHRDPA